MAINLQEEVPAVEGLLAGVDEAGRGPLVGNVVAAAVILDKHKPIDGLNDSKKLTAKRREQLAQQIRETAIAWSVISIDAAEIDRINILQATMLAMQQSVAQLTITPAMSSSTATVAPISIYRSPPSSRAMPASPKSAPPPSSPRSNATRRCWH